MKILFELRKYAPEILTGLGLVGVVTTAILSYQAGKKGGKKRIAATVISGAATGVAIVAAHNMEAARLNAALGASSLALAKLDALQNKVEEKYGKEGLEELQDEIAIEEVMESDAKVQTDKKIFHESYLGTTFEATEVEVLSAEYELNRLFILRGYASVLDFYKMLGIEEKIKNVELVDCEMYGWSLDCASEWGYEWIDFTHRSIQEDPYEVVEISYPFAPGYIWDDPPWE